MQSKCRWLLMILAGWLSCGLHHAHATDYVINTSINDPAYQQECTLYGAIQNINNQNNSFYPQCAPGTAFNTIRTTVPQINVTQEMSITGHTTEITGAILVSNGQSRIFRVGGAATLLLSRVRMRNGRVAGSGSGGAMLVDSGNLSLHTVYFEDNEAGTDGGALAWNSTGTLRVQWTYFLRNHAGQRGGALLLGGSTPAGQAASLIESSKFANNTAVLDGGGIYCTSPSRSAIIRLGNFVENHVSGPNGQGGGVSSFCNLDILISRFTKNIVDHGRGGAMYLAGPLSSVLDADIQQNLAGALPGTLGEGGGIFLDGAAYVIRGGLHKNKATTAGGGIFVGSAAGNVDVQIANVTFDANVASSGATKAHGGAVRFTGYSFPIYPLDPQLGYAPHAAQFVNNTVTDNDGLEQIWFEPGAANATGQIFFVNNLMRSLSVPGCGGMVARMQPRRTNQAGTQYNWQYPGHSCDVANDPMPELFAVLDFVKFGGLLGQAHRPPVASGVAPGPNLAGDSVICEQYPVFGWDQMRRQRACLKGAVEGTTPKVIPAGFPL